MITNTHLAAMSVQCVHDAGIKDEALRNNSFMSLFKYVARSLYEISSETWGSEQINASLVPFDNETV